MECSISFAPGVMINLMIKLIFHILYILVSTIGPVTAPLSGCLILLLLLFIITKSLLIQHNEQSGDLGRF